jgi:EAL domain-containing protein (putative c-di-GMP-specific phosphodiesterase class I)
MKTSTDLKKLFKKEDLMSNLEKKILIEEAIQNKNFFLVYQPKVSILKESLGEVCGLEALVRWNYNNETIFPSVFIDFCEKQKLIIPLGRYVIENVARDLNNWLEKGSTIVPCSINVTREQLHGNYRLLHLDQKSSFIEEVQFILEGYDLDSSLFEFELIERDTFNPKNNEEKRITFSDLKPVLEGLRNMGCKLSIDDYDEDGQHNIGTIRSRLFDFLKIDKKDIDSIPLKLSENRRPLDFSVFNDFLHYKENYQIPLIAEGVESKEQLNFLRTIEWHEQKIDMVQGFYFSRPIYPQEVAKVLVRGHFDSKF